MLFQNAHGLVLASVLLGAVASPAPISKRYDLKQKWANAACGVTVEDHPASQRWADADCNGAWGYATGLWNQGPNRPNGGNLNFTGYFSRQFHGPQLWECGTFGQLSNCGQTLDHCGDQHGTSGSVDVPAAYLIMNSFVRVHEVHQTMHDDLGTVASQMASQIGKFQPTFSPKLQKPIDLWKGILDTLGFMTGFFYAGVWNSVAKGIFQDTNFSGKVGELKDGYNTLISQSITAVSRHLPSNTDALGIQNDLQSTLGSFVSTWANAIANANSELFSGDSTALTALFGIINDGNAMQTLSYGDQEVLALVQNILYGFLIPKAWQASPTGLYPMVIASTDDCTSYANSDMAPFMNDATAASTHVCMNGVTYYVVNSKSDGTMEPLPGGTFENLSGGAWGGVRLDDIVASVVGGYKANNNANGYKIPDMASLLSAGNSAGGNNLDLTLGIDTPGFFTIPFCDSTTTYNTNRAAGNSGMLNWPCF